MVKQAPRCCHQHFHTRFELRRLRLHIHTAKHHGTAQARIFGILLHLLRHLVGQLACRQQHQRPHRVAGRRNRSIFVFEQTLQQRQRKRRRLASARLRRAHHILPSQHHWYRLRLNRRSLRVPHVSHRTLQRLGQRKFGIGNESRIGHKISDGQEKNMHKPMLRWHGTGLTYCN